MKQPEKYFAIGEFAKLFNISKQTLFYYEKNNIFQPAFIDENGYRYYSLNQYFIFEIIITLRKLNVPLQKIAKYIEHRDIPTLQEIFAEKQKEYDQQMQILTLNRNNLQMKIDNLDKVKKIRMDKITLENCAKEYLVVNNFLDHQVSMKEKIRLVAKHNLPFSSSEILNEYLMGYIIEKSALTCDQYCEITKIFTRVSQPNKYKNLYIKPDGLYATIFTPQGYHVNYQKALKKLFSFIDRNELQIIGNAYITQLRNYWSTDNPLEYVTQITIQVDYPQATKDT